MRSRWIGVFLMAALLAGSSAFAQVSTSNITGTVTDKSGAAVAGAKVMATNEGTGLKNTSSTTEAGIYAFASLVVGSYTITVEHEGFQKYVTSKNTLSVGSPLVINVPLEVGAITSVVQVESTAEVLETSNATLGDVVTHRTISELPLNGRNPLNLITLEPGLVQRTTGAAGSGTHVFGSRDRAHNLTIDGIDANESSVPNPQSNIFRLTTDNVQEYKVVTQNATPELGRNSGANVTIATRSGTNEFHGDAFWYHRNTVLNANEFFNNAQGIARPTLLLHQFGFDIGGPVWRNKTFFYGSWQDNRIKQRQPIAQSFGVPLTYTSTLKSGVFRYFVPDPANPVVIGGSTITSNSPLLVDPVTGALRSGVIPCATATSIGCVRTYNIGNTSGLFGPIVDPAGLGIDPNIASMVGTFPLPNNYAVGGDGLNFGGFAWNVPSRFTGPFSLVRVDHKFNDSNNLFGRMLWSTYNTNEGDLLNGRPIIYPGFNPLGEVFRNSQSLAVSYRRVISPALVNEFTTGYSRFNFLFSLIESNSANGLTPPPYGQNCFGTNSLRTIATPFCNTPHTQRIVSNIQFIDNLSYIYRAHVIRSGFNIRMYRHNDQRGVPGGFNAAPTIIFDRQIRDPFSVRTAPTANCAAPCTFPGAPNINTNDNPNLQNAIAELAGIPARVQEAFVADLINNKYVLALSRLGTRAKQFDSYIQDEWKLRPNLTLTYGVRWEWNPPARDCCGRTFQPDKPVDGSQGTVTFVRATSWWNRDNWRAFAPRVSAAWDPFKTGKTVVRAGYGIAFDTLSTFQVTAVGGKVPGISSLQCRVDVTSATAANGCQAINSQVRLSGLLALINPFTLSIPTVSPLNNTSPAPSPLTVAPDIGAFDPRLKVPTVHEWNLTVQRELPKGFVIQAGYVGKRGTHLYRAYDLNQISTSQTGFLAEFQAAQQNLFICRNNAAACLAAQAAATISAANRTTDNFANFGLAGQVPLPLLSALLGTGAVAATNTSAQFRGSNATDVIQNGLGSFATRTDTRSGTGLITLRVNPNTGLPFPANFFRPNPQFSQIFYFDSGGDSYYHGGIVQIQRRLEKGLLFGLSYTFSKSIDDMSLDPVGAASGGGLSTTNSRTPTDVHNFRLDRSRSDFDNRHVLVVNYLYELPFGKGKKWGSGWNTAVNNVLGGWQAAGIYLFQSGEPFTLISGVRTVSNTHVSSADLRGPLPGTALKAPSNTSVLGPVVFNASASLDNNQNSSTFDCKTILNTQSAFCIPPAGRNGNSGRNSLEGPGFWNTDFSVIKKFTVTERIGMQFRAEFFNLLNHVSFENPRNASAADANNRFPNNLLANNFGQTCCVTSAVTSSATIIAVGEPNRVIQFALKLNW